MALEKTLLLKGIAGVAAVGGVAGGGVSIAYKKGAFKSQEEKDKEAKNKKLEEVNAKLKTLGIEGCDLEDNNITLPSTFSKDCELDQSKFKKIKFSNRGDNQNEVTVSGWSGNNTVTLKIENKEDNGIKFLFKDPKSNLTITKSTTDQNDKITIRSGKDTEFKEKDGKLSKVVDENQKSQLESYNTKFSGLSLPEGCRFDESEDETSLECEVTEEQLKKIKFSNKGSGDLTINGWNSQGNIKLKIEKKENEGGHKYIFKDSSNKLTILGESTKGKITIKNNGEQVFGDSDGSDGERTIIKSPSDTNLSATLKGFNQKLVTLKVPNDCRFDEGESDTSIECDIKDTDLKKIEFSNKGFEDLKVNGWPTSGDIKLKVEKETSSDEMSLSFQNVTGEITIHGDKSKGKIVLKNSNPAKKFKVENNKLTKDASDNSNKTRFQGFNNTLGTLDIPIECRFDEAESETKVTCTVTKDDLKKIKFWNKQDNEPLTIDKENDFSTATLEVNGDNTKMKIYFKNVTKTIKLTGGSESFNLRQNSNGGSGDEYEVRDNVLGPVRNAKSKGNSLGLECTYTGKGNSGKCKASSSTLKVLSSSSDETGGTVNITDTSKDIFDFSEYEDGFNQLIKFTYTGETTPNGGTHQLVKNEIYHGQNKSNTWYLIKKNGGK